MRRYTLSDEFHNFKTSHRTRTGASVSDDRTSLRVCLVSVRTDAAFDDRSRAFGPDACGPADPAYIHTANETGGIPMFLQRSEAAKAFHLVRESTRNNVATVFWATGFADVNAAAVVAVTAFGAVWFTYLTLLTFTLFTVVFVVVLFTTVLL